MDDVDSLLIPEIIVNINVSIITSGTVRCLKGVHLMSGT